MIVKESNTGATLGKWKDKRDVMFLTTKYVPTLEEIATRRCLTKKPSTILQYNAGKSYIDVSDQLASYGTSVRRGLKWYRKVMFELLTNTAVVNAHAIYKYSSFAKRFSSLQRKFSELLIRRTREHT